MLATMGRLEARNLIPSQPQYDAAKNFRKLRMTWGWVPWEEPIGIVQCLQGQHARDARCGEITNPEPCEISVSWEAGSPK